MTPTWQVMFSGVSPDHYVSGFFSQTYTIDEWTCWSTITFGDAWRF